MQNENNFRHVPVLLQECISALNLAPGKTIVDATVGGAGHAGEIAKRIESGLLIGIDKDIEAIRHSTKILSKNKQVNIKLVHNDFKNITEILNKEGITNVDGILADLGVSSHQIDTGERGFSYMQDAPLDMRMNRDEERNAWQIVNHYKQENLQRIIFDYGEERWAKVIASAIVKARPIDTTLQLSKVIEDSVPGSYWKSGGHPAKRTFQAIRIEVNRELDIIEKFINDSVERLEKGGRIAIISFHSLEDRIVKQTMKRLATDCICPPKTPKCICEHKATLKCITKKPIEATKEEVQVNPRSSSAKLRIAEKL